MPGIIVFRRRWSVGSDDLVVPGIFLLIMHTVWLVVVGAIYGVVGGSKDASLCWGELKEHLIGYLVLLSSCILVEAFIAYVAMRGSILDPGPRASMQYLLYVRLVLLTGELVWVVLGVVWLARHYQECNHNRARDVILGIVVCNWCVLLSVLITVCCTFDAAGRSWVKMKKYQLSMRKGEAREKASKARGVRSRSEDDLKYRCRRSERNWRHRKVLRANQDSWDQRCRLLFCCINKNDTYRNSFGDIARLLSEFFRDLDVVPSDVVAGLVLLRKCQKMERKMIVKNPQNDVYQFLSGVPVTPKTQFLQLNTPEGEEEFRTIVHYMRFALSVYGWLMYVMRASSFKAACQLCPKLRCCGCSQASSTEMPDIVEDNCCMCNTAALYKMAPAVDLDLIYVTYHVDVGETPFFVALDHSRKAVVISIRGTISMKDVITDLNAESEPLPMDVIKEDWLGHKGMVQAAEYIRCKLRDEGVLERAFSHDPARGTDRYNLVLVGHSLGAGTAAILAILLRQQHANLSCYAYSPPGGLLSKPVVEYTRSFITSVVVGKDVVPRIGLHQMETLRADLITAIQHSDDPKWKTIASTMWCCGGDGPPIEEDPDSTCEQIQQQQEEQQQWSSSRHSRNPASHPSDSSIALTMHQPLYPPGRILHVVRHHPDTVRRWRRTPKPVYQAIWVDNVDFGEVLISPCMIQDHMPDKVLEALELVLESPGPAKPQRKTSTPDTNMSGGRGCRQGELSPLSAQSPLSAVSQDQPKLSHSVSQPLSHSLSHPSSSGSHRTGGSGPSPPMGIGGTPPHKLCLETSFTCSPVTSPQQRPDLRVHALAHALSWELVSALEEQLLSSGFPQGYQIGCPEVPTGGQWAGHAPLASPETLSDSSSLSSRLSIIQKDAWHNNTNQTPSPPLSPSAGRRQGTSRKNKSVDRGNRPQKQPSLPLLNNSPKIAPKKNAASLGQGYCFYIDTPPHQNGTSGPGQLPAVPITPTPDNPQRFTPSPPPPQYITLSPIVPSHDPIKANSNQTSVNERDRIRETLDELFRSIDKPPFVIDLEEDSNVQDLTSPESTSRSKGRSTDYLDSNSVEGFLDDDVKVSCGSRRSSLSLNNHPGQTMSQELTTSQMSRDSGYADRGTSGRQSCGTLADGVDEGKSAADTELDASIECKSWGDAQQEYGRGRGPPHPPHYSYCGVSPEHFPTPAIEPAMTPNVEEHFVVANTTIIHDNLHPLHGATPLLHGLKPSRKAAETSL